MTARQSPIRSRLRVAAALLLVAAACLSDAAHAQAQCEPLREAYEDGIKELSALTARGAMLGADPANYQTDRLVQVSLVQTNLSLLLANQCTPPKLPVVERAYGKNAFDCEVEMAGRRVRHGSDKEPIAACNRATWTRSPAR